MTDILNDISVFLLLLLEFLNYEPEVDEQLAVFLLWPVAIEMPAINLKILVKVSENRLFGFGWNGCIIFDSVETS